jgi:hypothetical protein
MRGVCIVKSIIVSLYQINLVFAMAKFQLSERGQNVEPVPTYVRMYFVRARFAVNRQEITIHVTACHKN